MSSMVYTFSMLERLGRLGNQLWQIASTIGLANEARARPVFNPTWEYRPYFNMPDKYFGNVPLRAVDRPHEYLQELHYWSHMHDHILEIFSIHPDLIPELEERWTDVNYGNGPTTSIHVRRGDYLKYPNAHPLCTPEYYARGIAAAKEIEPETNFIVFSDDIPYCKDVLFAGEDFAFVNGTVRPVEVAQRKLTAPEDYWDLQLMAKCDQHIISNSSFGWWGAMLANDQKAFYPSVWFGVDNSSIDWRAMIPDTWIEVDC